MKDSFFLALLGATGLCFCSCSVVLTKAPIADKTDAILQEQLSGIWQHEDGTIQFEFDSKGVGHVASLEWNEEKFSISQGEVQAATFQGESFLSLKPQVEDPDEETPGMFFGHFFLTENEELRMRKADLDVFEKLVASGEVKGTVEKGKYSTQVIVEDVRPLLQNPDAVKELFTDKDALLLRRLPVFEEE